MAFNPNLFNQLIRIRRRSQSISILLKVVAAIVAVTVAGVGGYTVYKNLSDKPGCTEHIDANSDNLCDNCQATINNDSGSTDTDTDDGKDDVTEECKHTKGINGRCSKCGEIVISSITELSLDKDSEKPLPNGIVSTALHYVEATVRQVVDEATGEMIIMDATGSIRVMQLWSQDDSLYGDMTEKPDADDKILILCTIEKVDDAWRIRTATLVSYESIEDTDRPLTIAEALALCGEPGNLTTERYYIRGTVKTITNPTYGAMVIYDETGEIDVYNTSSSDGSVAYPDMESKPVKGDEVLLYCTLQNHNGTKEIKSAWLIEFTHNEPEYDPSQYAEMTIDAVREAAAGTKVKVSGVVAQITYANGFKPNGVILVDGTSSIYVYDGDLAGQAAIGNTVTIAAEKTYWILDDEIYNAGKYGYKGACQLDNVTLLSNDNGNTSFNKSWITETTVKEIMDTPVTENITNKIFKVNALVKKSVGTGFTNYYFDDIDGITGSYTYTQCNGNDFGWLDKFDNKICTVYIVAINAKSSASGCVWRFLPIEVIDEGYVFDTDKAAEYAVKYHGIPQFLTEYSGDPEAELSCQISSDLLGFAGATLHYSSSNEKSVYFTYDTPGVAILHCGESGSATVTVTGAYNGKEYSEDIVITVVKNDNVDYVGVSDAIAAENGSTVTVKGIVGPSLVNQTGFYLIDDKGAIPVRTSKEVMTTLEIGYEVIISGTRTVTKDGGGQICIDNATVVSNLYGSHSYSTDSFITGMTISDIYGVADSAEATTNVYITTAKVYVNGTSYSVTIHLRDTKNDAVYVLLYSGGKDQYKWLQDYDGMTITVELALCDWNAKGLKGCVLAVVNEDGSKVFNTLNFN